MSRVTPLLRHARAYRPLYVAGLSAALVLGAAAGFDAVAPPDLARADRISTQVVDREGRVLRAFTTRDGMWRLPAKPGDVSPLYLQMLVAYEDRRFQSHAGVDPQALARALWQWASEGEIVSGGSTLTMQVARLLEPRTRSVAAKGIEILRALQLEARLTKAEILGLYLTLAPYGGNLEGVRAASFAWFGKEPRHLTPGQAALLVALPQAPTTIRPDRFPQRARAARNKILGKMIAKGVLTEKRARAAMAEPLPSARRPMPFDAPHLARRLRNEAPGKRLHRTTLDRALQNGVVALVRRELSRLDGHATIAALVIENRTREVRAYVGSADFLARARDGQVDMIRAVRSPGSTLKPFIYGMAFDQRIVHPDTLVIDSPTRFGGYRPENFQRAYYGEVSVRFALQHSLNVPAVAVLDGLGPVRFASALKAAGAPLRLAADAGKPGLPIALGGAGMSLFDLATLYAGLANGGLVAPLRVTRDGKPKAAKPARLVSAAATWQLARILEKAPPPTDYVPAQNVRGGRAIAYKTGTSYGFRDAWAVGYDDRYTVAIWVGRPDGTPSPERYGRNTAAPILFRVFDLAPGNAAQARPPMPKRPAGVLRVASNAELPANLRSYFRGIRSGKSITAAAKKPLTIVFPPNGALVELDRDTDGKTKPLLPLAAEGGKKPLRWLVNGVPVNSLQHRRQAEWRTDGVGFVRVTVIDAAGNTARSVARVR